MSAVTVPVQHPPLIEALLRPSFYPHPAPSIELVQTHISYVVMAGDHVYKVKKPVNFGFLDFTTVEKRRRVCHREVELNRRLTRDVYRGVVEFTRSGDAIRWGGDGEVVDVAVAMRRLPDECGLVRRLDAGSAGDDVMRRIARAIARFHRTAARMEETDRYGSIAAIRALVEQNAEQTERYVGRTVTRPQWERVRSYSRAFLDRHGPLFARRIEEGRIRDCHGDLRAEHVFLEGDDVQVIDCIEFNREFRCQDTASDLAFLTMDLDRLGYPAQSNVVLNAYLEESGDYGLVPVLDFYRVYRAYVRGKVTSFLLDDPGLSEPERAAAADRARRFFDLAMASVEREGTRGRLFITCGITGTGKSTVARALAKARGGLIVRSDAVRKSLAGLAPIARAHGTFGEGIYDAGAGGRTYRALLEIAETALRSGKEVIVDATFIRREFRDAARSLADALGVPLSILWCRADDAEIDRRLIERARDAENISDGRIEIAKAQRLALDPFDKSERPSVIPIDTSQDEAVWIRAVAHAPC